MTVWSLVFWKLIGISALLDVIVIVPGARRHLDLAEEPGNRVPRSNRAARRRLAPGRVLPVGRHRRRQRPVGARGLHARRRPPGRPPCRGHRSPCWYSCERDRVPGRVVRRQLSVHRCAGRSCRRRSATGTASRSPATVVGCRSGLLRSPASTAATNVSSASQRSGLVMAMPRAMLGCSPATSASPAEQVRGAQRGRVVPGEELLEPGVGGDDGDRARVVARRRPAPCTDARACTSRSAGVSACRRPRVAARSRSGAAAATRVEGPGERGARVEMGAEEGLERGHARGELRGRRLVHDAAEAAAQDGRAGRAGRTAR